MKSIKSGLGWAPAPEFATFTEGQKAASPSNNTKIGKEYTSTKDTTGVWVGYSLDSVIWRKK